ncbi:hypothetical protein ACN9MZ_24855 [Pseudoduganella sp. S-14]|uniref:hypothetical protein n=1 Tax=Pseudoduganella sp. S-14 TaxID=3404065 RepID=UPI003CE8E117
MSKPQKAEFYYVPWDYMQSLDDDEVFVDDDGLELPLALKDKICMHVWSPSINEKTLPDQ